MKTVEMMTREQAAQFLRVSKSWLSARATAGQPPRFLKMGGKVFYLQADLEEFLKSSFTVTSKPKADIAPPARVRKQKVVKPPEPTGDELVKLFREGKLKITGS